jgi:hypothetical protein
MRSNGLDLGLVVPGDRGRRDRRRDAWFAEELTLLFFPPEPTQLSPVEERINLLRRRSELYRVCLRDRIGAATAAEYFREVLLAEAELSPLLIDRDTAGLQPTRSVKVPA